MDHRLLRGRVAVVELQSIGPAREKRISPVCQQQVALGTLYPGVVLRRRGVVEFRPVNEILRMIFDPGMTKSHVIRHKIEHETQVALAKPLTKPGQGPIAAESLMDGVSSNGKSRAGDVLLAQVRQNLLKFSPPLGVAARHLPRSVTGLPYAQHPNPIKTLSRHTIQARIGNVVYRGATTQSAREFSEPDPGVDLIKRRIARRSHRRWSLSRRFKLPGCS